MEPTSFRFSNGGFFHFQRRLDLMGREIRSQVAAADLTACHSYGRHGQSAEEVLAELERRAELQEALAQLPAEQRQAIEWRYFDNLTVAEIAERLGLSRDSVKRRLAAALAALRRRLRAATAAA